MLHAVQNTFIELCCGNIMAELDDNVDKRNTNGTPVCFYPFILKLKRVEKHVGTPYLGFGSIDMHIG